jgi:hypothetical protein
MDVRLDTSTAAMANDAHAWSLQQLVEALWYRE